MPAEEAWRIATGAAAPLLVGERNADDGGGLRVGAPADFLLLRAGAPELSLGDLHADLVYSASGSVVDTTVVAGRVLMRGGEVAGGEEVVARARERARRLGIG
jgi:5-methylthioadenosine/S-adenosylhomocysteine deaminase